MYINIALRSEEEQATTTGNSYRKSGKIQLVTIVFLVAVARARNNLLLTVVALFQHELKALLHL